MANTQNRTDAVAGLVKGFLNDKHMLRQDVARADIVTAINALRPMGRTQRWSDALESWAGMVDESPLNMNWALLQGQVYALHAA